MGYCVIRTLSGRSLGSSLLRRIGDEPLCVVRIHVLGPAGKPYLHVDLLGRPELGLLRNHRRSKCGSKASDPSVKVEPAPLFIFCSGAVAASYCACFLCNPSGRIRQSARSVCCSPQLPGLRCHALSRYMVPLRDLSFLLITFHCALLTTDPAGFCGG